MNILAIESSCDETAAAVLRISGNNWKLLSNVIASQVKIHAMYGGVVPEVAARNHIENILPIIDAALKQAKIKSADVDYFAVCAGPGLMGSLLVGVETAKALAFACDKPLIKINHIEGHIFSAFFELNGNKIVKRRMNFPCLALVVSGGHTQIILMKDYLKYKLIGETRDDAAGETFDKAAKILGIGYPGGPAIAWAAAESCAKEKSAIGLPRPMLNSDSFEMSFSGLKTAVLYSWNDLMKSAEKARLPAIKSMLAKECQQAIIDVLICKTLSAARKFKIKTIVVGGGVSANQELRTQLANSAGRSLPSVKVYYPDLIMCGDNAAMIALAAYYHAKNKDFATFSRLKADPNWELA